MILFDAAIRVHMVEKCFLTVLHVCKAVFDRNPPCRRSGTPNPENPKQCRHLLQSGRPVAPKNPSRIFCQLPSGVSTSAVATLPNLSQPNDSTRIEPATKVKKPHTTKQQNSRCPATPPK
ncbi:hypothetical protein MTP99_002146 [Tenebrio molitor]|nr:hypothetical protein MTP99_002146 [Tenebrio molitor]